mmetsp:Transcript_31421/g.66548  ORF Transcript_31421/g.66548 Transcript_31421/m.66548 type:complete len:667 (-) Transcript_31421:268-2268(-)
MEFIRTHHHHRRCRRSQRGAPRIIHNITIILSCSIFILVSITSSLRFVNARTTTPHTILHSTHENSVRDDEKQPWRINSLMTQPQQQFHDDDETERLLSVAAETLATILLQSKDSIIPQHKEQQQQQQQQQRRNQRQQQQRRRRMMYLPPAPVTPFRGGLKTVPYDDDDNDESNDTTNNNDDNNNPQNQNNNNDTDSSQEDNANESPFRNEADSSDIISSRRESLERYPGVNYSNHHRSSSSSSESSAKVPPVGSWAPEDYPDPWTDPWLCGGAATASLTEEERNPKKDETAANNEQENAQQQQQQPAQQQQQQAAVAPTPAAAAPAPAVVEPDQGKAQPIYVDTQHDDMVHDAQLDYYGTKLATSSSDRTIKVYDVSGNSYSPNATLTGHSGPIYQLSWSHPKYGSILASASFDSSVRIHRESRPGEWILVKAFVGLHESSVNGVAFAPHEYGLCAAAGSSDGRVSVLSHEVDDSWTVEYLKDTPLGVNAVSWAPYGVGDKTENGEVQPMPPRLVTGGSDNGIRVWTKNATTGVWEQEGFNSTSPEISHKDWVRDVAWAPNVIPGRSIVASCSEDKTVIIWKQGGEDGDTTTTSWTPTVLNTFDDPVWRVSWSITGNILAVSSGDSTVTLWKEGLDGSWSQVSQVEDVAGGSKGDDAAVVGQQQS